MLSETNLQLGGIAHVVDTAQEKITRCMSELEQMVEQLSSQQKDTSSSISCWSCARSC